MMARRARAGRRRLAHQDADQGSALLFVLMVTTMIMLAVSAVLVSVTGAVLPSKHDQDTQAALAAAEAGVQDAMAYVSGIPACNQINIICGAALGVNSTTIGRPNSLSGCQSVTWTTDPKQTQAGYVRVRTSGTCSGITRKLVADIALAPNIFSFGYYSDYESTSPSVLNDMFAPRTISLTNSTTYGKVTATSVNAATTVTWNGTTTSAPQGVDVCGHHWYDDSTTSPGRYTLEQQRTSLQSGTDWAEIGKINNKSVTRYGSCNIVFTSGMTFNGQVYSRDALYLSNGTTNGTGPDFELPVSTLWSSSDNPAAGTNPWRVDSQVGGKVDTASGSYAPKTAAFDLQLPTSIGTKALPGNYCIYLGPTRIKLNGNGTATVTSPQTTIRDSGSDTGCYPTGSLASGILDFTLNYSTVGQGTIYVKNNGTAPTGGWADINTKSTNSPSAANTVFYQTSSAGLGTITGVPAGSASAITTSCATSTSAAATATCAWTNTNGKTGSPGWTASTATSCAFVSSAADQRLFDCEYTHTTTGNPATSGYGALRTQVVGDLAATALSSSCGGVSPGAATVAQITCRLNEDLAVANTSQRAANYSPATSGNHQYVVTSTATGTPTAGTKTNFGSAPSAPMAADDLFTNTTGTSSSYTPSTTATTYQVSRQVYACYSSIGVVLADIQCTTTIPTGTFKWAGSVPSFAVTISQTTNTFSAGTSATSYFPNVGDITRYSTGSAGANGTNGPGDLYVEGVNSGRISLLSDNDLFVTDDLTDKTADPTVDAIDIVAGNNVRNYNPMKCLDQVAADINATTAGSCPNDITGLSSSSLETNGVLSSAHPALQYVNMACTFTGNQNDAASNRCPRRIDAAVFALSGSFFTDNYQRGGALGQLMINGGLYQSFRGANGIQWQYQTGDAVRPSSGYRLNYNYVNLQVGRLPYAPPTKTGTVTKTWKIVSLSASN